MGKEIKDERLEKLLNKAGQTISDLPKGNRKEGAYPGQKVKAMQAVCQFDRMLDVSDVGILNCLDYILHLTDVIDRLEWALDNVTRERDYLLAQYAPNPHETVPDDWRADREG